MAPSCSEDQYSKEVGKCCSRCDAGEYKLKDCDGTGDTQCAKCGEGSFTATKNHMDKCLPCKRCNPNNNQITETKCTEVKNAVCACASGFYCSDASCDHCRSASRCQEGQGVKTRASGTNDTVCSPCELGTFSNVSDHLSACRAHTSCDDIGRELHTPGTATTDAICGNYKTSCGWMLPAGLWIGLVLTSLIIFAVVLFSWRIRRCRRHRTEKLNRPEAALDQVSPEEAQLKLPLPSKEQNELYQDESYKPSYSCELPAFVSDDVVISCDAQETDDSSDTLLSPRKAPVSFSESQYLNGTSGYSTGNYSRTISEPQEDEWCDT